MTATATMGAAILRYSFHPPPPAGRVPGVRFRQYRPRRQAAAPHVTISPARPGPQVLQVLHHYEPQRPGLCLRYTPRAKAIAPNCGTTTLG